MGGLDLFADDRQFRGQVSQAQCALDGVVTGDGDAMDALALAGADHCLQRRE